MENRNPYRFCDPDKFRVRLDISYDGTDFCGWQRQNQQASIQGTIEKAVAQIYGRKIPVIGASRTDSGVHAEQQVAHFDCPKAPEGFDLRYAIQCQLPESIVIKKLYKAPAHFHSIACAIDKTYEYRVLNRHVPSALRRRYTYWLRAPLKLELLNDYAKVIVGEHDFKAFQTSGTVVNSTVRKVISALWIQEPADTICFEIRGEGFLKQMVRNLVGTMIDLAREEAPVVKMQEILDSRDRRQAGATAPPEGLLLKSIRYPSDLDIQCHHLY